MADEPEITFNEFAVLTAEEGYPLYAGISEADLSNFKKYVFHFVTLKVLPKKLYTEESEDHINIAHLPKKIWHRYYAEALLQQINRV